MGRFDRGPARYKQQPRVLVLCEDTKSSLNYLQDASKYFRSHAIVKIINCGKNDPLSIVKEAIKNKKNYDNVYCVIDRDKHPEFNDALGLVTLQRNKGNDIELIASYPCYEYWLVLHFTYTRKPHSATDTHSSCDLQIKDLCQKNGMHDYKKSDKGLFDLLIDRLPIAMSNAEKSMQDAIKSHEYNPSTRIHELIQKFVSLGNPQPVD